MVPELEAESSRFLFRRCSPSVIPAAPAKDIPHPLHNPSYLSESRLRINAASSSVTHALEKKAQEFGIYKTSYPDGTPRNPAISEKTNLEMPTKTSNKIKLSHKIPLPHFNPPLIDSLLP